jgi:hypothetical protein
MPHNAAGILLALAALAPAPVWGQSAARGAGGRCPRVSVSCPPTTEAGSPVIFTAEVVGGGVAGKVTYKWAVSAGEVTGGQGGPSIEVKAVGADGVEATVEVGGLPDSCPQTASCATQFTGGVTTEVDEYGPVSFEDEQVRLNRFVVELQNDPTAQGYLIGYGGRRGRDGEAQRRLDRAREYLVNTLGVAGSRLVTIDGGFREELTVELFVVPQGAHPPAASQTIDPAEVELTTEESEAETPPGRF